MSRVTQVQNFARAGYLARAVVYILVGYFALNTASSKGASGVLEQILSAPGGQFLLILTGIGLLGYAIFRLYGAALDIQGNGTGAKGLAKRIGHAASGLGHLYLAYFAISTATGTKSGGGGGGAGEAASGVASMPGGEFLLIVIGLGFLGAAVAQGVKAYTGKFMGLLDADAPAIAKYLGHAGYAARAVVFAVIGYELVTKTLAGNAGAVGGIGKVLSSLRDTQWLYMAVAFGLLLFGLFSLVMARYRTIRNEDVIERLKAEAR